MFDSNGLARKIPSAGTANLSISRLDDDLFAVPALVDDEEESLLAADSDAPPPLLFVRSSLAIRKNGTNGDLVVFTDEREDNEAFGRA
jgi:hypothetical protein